MHETSAASSFQVNKPVVQNTCRRLCQVHRPLARELDKTHPGAAASLREGMAETLTILRLDVPPTLARTLHSANPIESMIGICREHSKNVKRWRDGTMALRWCAARMLEAGHQFRRVNGHLHLPKLRAALEGWRPTSPGMSLP
jgi:putative transposase